MRIRFKANPHLKGTIEGEMTKDHNQYLIVKLEVAYYIVEGVLINTVVVLPSEIEQEQDNRE